MNALAQVHPEPRRRGGGTPEVTWSQIAARAPVMVATMASYLDQLEVSARPSTVANAELTLRLFAHRVTEADPSCVSAARIGRSHIEDFKTWLAARRGRTGKPLATITIRHRLSTVRTFFERIMEWDYDDAPARLFVYMSDFPALDEPLPKFLDCQRPSEFPHRRPCNFPADGHEKSPGTAIGIPQGRPRELPADGHVVGRVQSSRGFTPLPEVASARRTDSPSVTITWAW